MDAERRDLPGSPLAHVRRDEVGRWHVHPLTAHLEGTARLAGTFAESFGNEDWGRLAGLWHDLGKFSPEFQSYIRKASGYDPDAHMEGAPGKVDHSTAGALLAQEKLGPAGRLLAYLIAGHHAGLPDWSHEMGVGGSLSARLEAHDKLANALAGSPEADMLQAVAPASQPSISAQEDLHLWIRMLFSCLVDADSEPRR